MPAQILRRDGAAIRARSGLKRVETTLFRPFFIFTSVSQAVTGRLARLSVVRRPW